MLTRASEAMQTGQARFGWAGSMVRSGTIRYGLSEPLVLNGSNSYEAVKAIESTDVDETCPSLLYALSHDLKCSLLTVSWEKKKKVNARDRVNASTAVQQLYYRVGAD